MVEGGEGLSPFWVLAIVMASRETLFPSPRKILVLAQTKTDCPMIENFFHLFFQHFSAFGKIIGLDHGDIFPLVLNYMAENYAQRQR
jgi:hypothetical protein